MLTTNQPERESKRTLQRLLPRVEKTLSDSISSDPQGWQEFNERLKIYFPSLFNLYLGLYGARYDFFFHLEDHTRLGFVHIFQRGDQLAGFVAALHAEMRGQVAGGDAPGDAALGAVPG